MPSEAWHRPGPEPLCRLSDGDKIDSMSLMLYMSPVAAAALVPAAMLLEPNCIAAARELSTQYACALSREPAGTRSNTGPVLMLDERHRVRV